LESVEFQDGSNRKTATARVKRFWQNPATEIQEGWRNFKFIKESDGWRLFRSEDITDQIVEQFIKSGFTDEVKGIIQILRANDPFEIWDKNDTNVLSAAFKRSAGETPIFPWDIQFTITSNKVDRFQIGFAFSLQNMSSNEWNSPFLAFELKRNGKGAANNNVILQNIRSGQEIQGDTSFITSETLQNTTKYELDVSYSSAGKQFFIVQNFPIEFKVQGPNEQVRFEVVKTSFELVKSLDFRDMWTVRVDYRIKNISSQPLKDLSIKCVWSLMNDEILGQSSDNTISYGDLPLEAGQTKVHFINCNVGYEGRKVPVKVDIYLESDGKQSVAIKALFIK
jgi:hypothetical protein